MDVTERINDIGTRRNHFVVDVHFGTKITPHSSVRLSDAEGLANNCVKGGGFRLPHLEGNGREMG